MSKGLKAEVREVERRLLCLYARVCVAINRKFGDGPFPVRHPLMRLYERMSPTILTLLKHEHAEVIQTRGLNYTKYNGKILGLEPNGKEACEIRLWSGTDEWPGKMVMDKMDTFKAPGRYFLAKAQGKRGEG